MLTTSNVVKAPGLRRVRESFPLSQRDLAKLAGVAASTIARVESGEEAHASTIRRLAAALQCSTHDLMEPVK